MEPLESTSIHLIQVGVTRLIKMFPFDGDFAALSARYNAQANVEFERIRDFIVLHYKLTQRDDTPVLAGLSRHGRARLAGRAHRPVRAKAPTPIRGRTICSASPRGCSSWSGNACMPRHFHRMGGMLGEERLRRALESLQAGISRGVAGMPLHKDFLRSYCPAEKT